MDFPPILLMYWERLQHRFALEKRYGPHTFRTSRRGKFPSDSSLMLIWDMFLRSGFQSRAARKEKRAVLNRHDERSDGRNDDFE